VSAVILPRGRVVRISQSPRIGAQRTLRAITLPGGHVLRLNRPSASKRASPMRIRLPNGRMLSVKANSLSRGRLRLTVKGRQVIFVQ
jgi:hypothetical protein